MHAPVLLALALPGLTVTLSAQEETHHGLSDRLGPGTSTAPDSVGSHGSWSALSSALEQRGATLALSAIADVSWPWGADVRERRSDRVLLDASLELDLERLFGWRRTTLFAEGYSQSGRNASRDVGDVQVFSNIDEDDVTQLAELWIEHRARPWGSAESEDTLRIKLGKLDANSEFAHVDAGLPFIHSSAGFSPTIFVFPSYPDPAVSLNVFATPFENVRLGVGLYNADEDGAVSGKRGLTADFDAAFTIGQADLYWDGGRVALGAWRHSGDLARFDGGVADGTGGWYALAETRLDRDDAGPELNGFVQLGVADEDVAEVALHAAAGVLVTGLFPRLESRRGGLYVSHVELSDDPAAGLGGSELALEIFQEIPLTRSILVKPDLQWIHAPGGADVDAAWVATLRFELVL